MAAALTAIAIPLIFFLLLGAILFVPFWPLR
jgi:hypothetical protein